MDNGDPESHEDYKSAQHSASMASALPLSVRQIVRRYEFVASSPDLAQAILTLTTQRSKSSSTVG